MARAQKFNLPLCFVFIKSTTSKSAKCICVPWHPHLLVGELLAEVRHDVTELLGDGNGGGGDA
jgi:hypothetical protein